MCRVGSVEPCNPDVCEVQANEASRANATMCNTKGRVSFLVVVE